MGERMGGRNDKRNIGWQGRIIASANAPEDRNPYPQTVRQPGIREYARCCVTMCNYHGHSEQAIICYVPRNSRVEHTGVLLMDNNIEKPSDYESSISQIHHI